MKKALRRFTVLALSFACISSPASVKVSALGQLPSPNSEPRHIVCTELSEQAEAYYTGEYSFENLITLSGAQDVSTSFLAAQNNELYGRLHDLMSETHEYYTGYSGYKPGSLAYFWNSTDAVSGSPVYTMFYSDISSANDGVKLNREHVWPKSRSSFGEKNGGSDLHHLRPSVDKINSAKSDHLFGNINGVYSSGVKEIVYNDKVYCYVKSDLDMFECKDDVKGDVSRILLYVYCRWNQPNLYTDMTDNLPDPDPDSKSDSGLRVIESLDTLLSWCESDPVDTWEMRRNDLTEEIQGNRNVFIDYPELAWSMFGKEAPEDMPTPSGSHTKPARRLWGDADSDGEITAVDATLIQRAVTRVPNAVIADTQAADVNGDGLDIADATMIQRHVLHIRVPCPVGEPI